MIQQTDDDGTLVEWDDEPVNKLVESVINGKYDFVLDYPLIKSFNNHQLLSMVSQLALCCIQFCRQIEHGFTPEHTELVEKLNALRQAAKASGMELWPEMGKLP
jgi:hypothetical protein